MISTRLSKILFSLVDEYIDSGDPVGSKILTQKYKLGVSPATVRNVMVELTNQGYIHQPHLSAGRIPKHKAYRLYVNQYAQYHPIPDEIKESFQRYLENKKEEALQALNYCLELVSEAILQVGISYDSKNNRTNIIGLVNLLHYKEFDNIAKARNIIGFLEKKKNVQKLISRVSTRLGGHQFFIGDDIGFEELYDCSVAFLRLKIYQDDCLVGFAGPVRMDYQKTLGAFRYLSQVFHH